MKKALLLLFLASPVLGANLPPDSKIQTYDDFSGGLNTLFPTHNVPPNFSPFMRNFFIDNNQMTTPNGFAVLGSSIVLQKVSGIFPYALENGSVFYLVTDSSVTLETQDFKSWVFVSSGSNSGSVLNWFQVRNKMWGVNGLDFPITWDHTSKAILDGTKVTPNVPKFRYGEYYQDRVFGFNISGSASDLAFTSVITTDNVIIAPDDSRAWPVINLLHVGQGDGQIGTAIWIYDGRLRLGKERSLYTLFGDNPFNYNPIKQEGQVGVASDESVALLDQNSYWMGQDGIYENSKRISDLIRPDIDTFKKSQSAILSNSWDTKADFDRGQYQGSSSTVDGLLFIVSPATGITPTGIGYFNPIPPAPGGHDITNSTTFYGPIRVNFGNNISSNSILYTTSVVVNAGVTDPSMKAQLKMIIENSYTGVTVSTTVEPPFFNAGNSPFKIELSSQSPVFEGWQINQASYSIKWECAECNPSDVIRFAGVASVFNDVEYFLVSATTGQFISDVSTITNSINAWGVFDSLRTTNQGTINYAFRTSTSVVNITTKTWSSINPGVTISEPLINNYIQWAATISAISANSLTNIDNVKISHVEGQVSIQRAIGIDWKNRYWLSVSTQSNTAKREIYVKSLSTNKNPYAWMPLDGVDICSFARYGDVFYGGSCSTGTVYRLDYGTNYNGMPINSIYKTPSISFGDDFFDKEIIKYLLYGEKNSNGIVRVDGLVDEGVKGVTLSTFSVNGSGAYNQIIEGVRNKGKTLDLTVSENDLDQPMVLHNLSVIYQPTQVLSNK